MTRAPFATLVLDHAEARPEAVDQTVASVREQTGVEVELLQCSGAEGFQAAVSEAAGEFVGVLAPGEALVPGALRAMASAVEADTDLIYGDEVVLPGPGEGADLQARPAWSPDRLLGHDWLGHPALFRTTLAAEACRDDDLGPAWQHDLALRVGARLRRATRVSEPLLRGPGRTPASAVATADTVRAHLSRLGLAARVTPGDSPGTCRVQRLVTDDLSVAVVIVCQEGRGMAWGERRWFALEATRSLLRHAGHANLEVVVVHQSTLEPQALDQLLGLGEQVRLVHVPEAPTRAQMTNRGVLTTHAEVLVLLDEHVQARDHGFVRKLVGPLADRGVGLTGARLLGSHGHLRQAGYAFHQHRFEPMWADVPASDPGPAGLLTIAHEVSGLGRGALALRRETFDAVGGLQEQLHHLDDIDLSQKVRHVGLRRVWVPDATAYQLDSPYRATVVRLRREREKVRGRWRAPDLDEYAPAFGVWHAERDRRSGEPAELSAR